MVKNYLLYIPMRFLDDVSKEFYSYLLSIRRDDALKEYSNKKKAISLIFWKFITTMEFILLQILLN